VVLIILLSYPFIFMLVRGHLFSLLHTLICVILFTKRFKNGNDYINTKELVLFSILLNIRPNSIFLLPLLIPVTHWFKYRVFIKLTLATLVVFVISYYIANYYDNNYTLESFAKSVYWYKLNFVNALGVHDIYSTSLLSALKYIPVFYGKISSMIPLLVLISLALIFIASYFYKIKKIDYRDFFIIVVCVFFVLSPYLSIYYLPFFLIPYLFGLTGEVEGDPIEIFGYTLLFSSLVFSGNGILLVNILALFIILIRRVYISTVSGDN